MEEASDEIEEFRFQKVNEFEEQFEKFEKEKCTYLRGVKEQQKERIQQKKEIQKQMLKVEMKLEIMKEISMEKNINMIPTYDKSINYSGFDDMFLEAIDNGELSKKDIEKLKKEAEEASIAKKLS
jgi:hypothetical protein